MKPKFNYNTYSDVSGINSKLKTLENSTLNIENSKQVLAKTFKFSNDIICTIDAEGKFILVSDSSLMILGYGPEELSGTLYVDYVCNEDKIRTQGEEQDIQAGHSTASFENRYVHKNGSLVCLLWSAHWDSEEKTMYCIARDITAYKAAVRKTEETEYLLNETQRFSKMGSWSFNFEENKLTWSDSLYHVFGVDKIQFAENYESFLDFIVPEDKEFVIQTSKDCQLTGKPFTINYRIITPNGQSRIIEEIGYSEKDTNGTVTRLFGTAQDITNRKQTELALKETNQKYKYLFENSPLSLFIFDFQTLQIVDCNYETLLLYGYSREEFLSLTIIDIRPEEDRDLIVDATSSEKKYGEVHKKNWRHLKKNGEIFHVDITGHLITYEGKKCSFVSISDITKRKELEKKEKEHTQFIETTLENLPIGIAVNRINEGTATLMNQKFSDIYGWPKETLTDVSTFFEKVYPDKMYRDQIISRVVSDLESKDSKRMNWEEIRITTQNQGERIINATNIPLYDQNLMISTVVDVTEKYNIQKSLEESNERYRYVSMATSDAIWDWDLLSDTFYWGEGINSLFGYQYTSNTNHQSVSWLNLFHKEDYDSVFSSLEQIIKSKKLNWKIEHRVIKKDGTIAYVNQRAKIIRDSKGKAIRLVGAIRDVTERKVRELQLKLLESVITNTNDAVLITEAEPSDAPGPKILFVNDAFTKMTGYTSEEVVGKTPRLLQGPKTDKNELLKLSKAISLWEPCEITTINYNKAGNEFWANFAIAPVTNDKGSCTHWVSIQRDVTETKIEEEKRILINEISTIFNNTDTLQANIKTLLSRISEIFDYPLQGLWLLDDEEDVLNLISYNYNDSSIINLDKFFKNDLQHSYTNKGKGILGKVWEIGKIVKWSLNHNDEYNQLLEKETIESGIEKATAIPLLYNNTLMGTLVIAETEDVIRYNDKIIFSEEISLHLGAEIKRKQLEQELSKIFNFSPDVVCVVNFNGQFKRINPAGCYLFGHEEAELLKMNITDLVHPEDFNKAKKKIQSLLKKEQTVYFESRIITGNGGVKWVAWTASSTKDGFIYAIGKDINEIKEAENQLKILNDNLLKQTKKLHISNEELEQFAYVASHDLQEPLRMVTSFLTLIERKYNDKLDEKGLEYIRFAVEGAKNMRQIILDLLNFSRISDNQDDTINYETINLEEIIKDVCLLQSKLINEKKAQIIFKNLPKLFSTRHYLTQLFQNIISNALKYSKDEVPLKIKISSKSFKTYYLISITDNGIGIEKEYFDKIFTIFQRLHTKDEYQGNGMGLAIAKKIVDKFNGKIWVESELGVGSTFYVMIPKINDK